VDDVPVAHLAPQLVAERLERVLALVGLLVVLVLFGFLGRRLLGLAEVTEVEVDLVLLLGGRLGGVEVEVDVDVVVTGGLEVVAATSAASSDCCCVPLIGSAVVKGSGTSLSP
jgi:hypothetical protein